jgi:tetratricopeptide (TPR) repeat protein
LRAGSESSNRAGGERILAAITPETQEKGIGSLMTGSALLTDALKLHQGGQLPQAARIYQQVLVFEPDDADAMHLLGVVRHQQGDHHQAIDLIGRAVVLRPNIADFHINLAEAYRASGKFDLAVGCCRTALRLRPDCADALTNLGLALHGRGSLNEAADCLRRALTRRADAALHSNLGLILGDLGLPEEALKHFRQAVALAPDFAPARTNLGVMLLNRDRAEEALSHCLEAVRLQPSLAQAHHNLGNVYRRLLRFKEARASWLEAIRLTPQQAASHAQLGLTLWEEGEPGQALTWLQQAADLESDNVAFHEHLAELHSAEEEPAKAIPCWRRVLELEPGRASAHNALGWALQDEGQFGEAEEHYRTALRLHSDWGPALVRLGGLQEEQGNLEQAEGSFRTAVRAHPAYPFGHARLATLLRGRLPEEDLAGLEQRLADPDLNDAPRSHLLFALAHVRDGRGDYARAAECLREANRLSREQAKQQHHDYDPAEHERFVDRLTATFTPAWFAQRTEAGLPTHRPVFVFGLPRSGTTLTEQVLASHPRVHGAGELRLARSSFTSIPSLSDRSEAPLACVPDPDAGSLRRLAQQHEEKLGALASTAVERIVDKMPDNYLYLGLLAALFPNATFIHCRRDLRDVAVSCWMTDFRSIRWADDPGHIAARFGQYRRVMEHWRKVLPVPLHEVDYEETVTDLEGVARRLLDACGLEWDPRCLEFHRLQRPVRTASVTQVRQPLHTRSVARWKHYASDLGDLFAALPGGTSEDPCRLVGVVSDAS